MIRENQMQNYLAEIKITLRQGILDVQGKTVENSLKAIDFPMISSVRIGKFVTLAVSAENKEKALEILDAACKGLIANPIIEDYFIDIKEA